MSLFNHQLIFRPLIGGVEIFNPRVNEVGTLGFIARDTTGGPRRWLVSCYHVLVGGPSCMPEEDDQILQPSSHAKPVAFVDVDRVDSSFDCAAAIIADNIDTAGAILGIGPLGSPLPPAVGLRVIKSGATTGVTEGIIEEVNGHEVIIGHAPGFDLNYDLSLPGDSGALWLSRDGLAPVALHVSETGDIQKRVKARCLLTVLDALRLQVDFA